MANYNVIVSNPQNNYNVTPSTVNNNTNVESATIDYLSILNRLSVVENKLATGKLIFVGENPPENPSTNDLWLEINN